MRAKISGEIKIIRPAPKVTRCVVRAPKPAQEPGNIYVKRRGPCGGAIYYKTGTFGRSKKEIVPSKTVAASSIAGSLCRGGADATRKGDRRGEDDS